LATELELRNDNNIMKNEKISLFIFHAARILAAVILLQTLYFKFTGSPESVYIFSRVGMEPWGRFAVGTAELIAGVLLLVRPTVWLGALMALGLMAGALMMHFTLLGIEVENDKGYLFLLACIVTVSSAYALWHERQRPAVSIAALLKRST
jgi:putative oxidoreductase